MAFTATLNSKGRIALTGTETRSNHRLPYSFYVREESDIVELVCAYDNGVFLSGPASEWTNPSGTADEIREAIEELQDQGQAQINANIEEHQNNGE